ncbi:hypothetical protein HMPREF1870_02922 [Bacteroidales bacterium KA00344]|nr:hypothetical protein HMPREF1870_02922 [Bacteroidales bacterium KA00344]
MNFQFTINSPRLSEQRQKLVKPTAQGQSIYSLYPRFSTRSQL